MSYSYYKMDSSYPDFPVIIRGLGDDWFSYNKHNWKTKKWESPHAMFWGEKLFADCACDFKEISEEEAFAIIDKAQEKPIPF